MALTEGDRAIMRETAFEVAEVIERRLLAAFEKQVELHQATCPVKMEVQATLNQAKGGGRVAVLIAAIISGVAGLALSIWAAMKS